jgi:hypothetical protein
MNQVTLSALRLKKCHALKSALHRLACALWAAEKDPSLPELLIKARERSRDFAGGLYVDLFDFCKKLLRLLRSESEYLPKYDDASREKMGEGPAAQLSRKQSIKTACEAVIKALDEDSFENPNDFLVLANCSADSECHGLSLYFPYLSEQQYAEVGQPMVKGGRDTGKGGRDTGKGFSAVLNQAASILLMCVRRQLIVDTESYYEGLKLAHDTGWYRFIAKQWSKILVELEPEKLDSLYSAQQSAVNTCKVLRQVWKCPPDEHHAEPPKRVEERAG